MPDNMFSLSGGGINPPQPGINPGALSHDETIAQPVVPNAADTMGKWAEIQNQRNQNTLFQQTFAARQRSGDILANSPDTETAIKALLADPITAPFAGETINTLRQAQLSLVQMQGEVQKQSQSGLEGFYKSMPAILAHPDQFDTITKAELATLSPMARQQVEPVLDSIKKSIFADLPADPKSAAMMMTQRMVGYSMAAGIPPDSIAGLIGKQGTMSTGSTTQSGVYLPPQFGGGFIPQTTTPLSAAPQRMTEPLGPKGTPTTVEVSGGVATPVTMAQPGGSPSAAGGATGTPAGGPESSAPPSPKALDNLLAAHHGNIDEAIASAPSDAIALALGDRYEKTHGIAPGTGGRKNLMTGPSQTDSAANEASGKVAGEITSDMATDAREIPTALKRFDVMTNAMTHFEPGGLANPRASIARLMQGLKDAGVSGITQAKIDSVGNASLADTQVFEANVKPLVIAQLKAAAQGTGRVMRSEVDAFLSMMSTETDPRALLTLLNQAKYSLQVGYARSKMWPQYRDGVQSGQIKGELPDFYQYFNDHQNMMHLPGQTGGGLNVGPTKAAPASSQKVTHKWIPGKGIVPVGGQ